MHFRRSLIATLLAAPLALGGAGALAQHLTGVPNANPQLA
jgi:hypothetical protein